MSRRIILRSSLFLASASLLIGCGGTTTTTTTSTNTAYGNSGNATTNVNSAANTNVAATTHQFNEPNAYQGVMRLTFQTMGQQPQNNQSMPPIVATVARNGADRMMEFTLPTNEKIQYIEKGDMKYIVLPSRKQYAELTAEALGFEVRKMMTPE